MALGVAAIAVASMAVSAQIAPLRLVSTAWSPFTNDSTKPRFATDLVDAALGRIGITANTTIVEPAAFTPALLSAAYDGSAAAWKDPERERALVFSQPYLENRLVLVGRKGADVSATSWAALKGKKIALVGGYAYGDIEGAGPAFVKTKGEEDSLTQLLRGQADYALMDDLVVQYLLDNYAKEAQARLQLGSKPLITRPLYFAIRQSRPDAESIINRFNAQLRGMAIPPSPNPLALGVLAGDPAGFPNGRRPIDDVVDIALRVMAGATPLTPNFNTGINAQLGDGVFSNDKPLPNKFPYIASPHAGNQ